MCNLYRMKHPTAEVADLFRAVPDIGSNYGSEVYPGYPGVVVAEGRTRVMAWGFPRHAKSRKTGLPLKPSPVNNARDDRLLDPWFPWKESFEQRRCLIPVTQWAEPEGEKGRMTRTWYSLHGADLFAVAGIWRPTVEWGDAYSMVIVDRCPQMFDVHDRMPVILRPNEWEQWTQGSPVDAMDLMQTCIDPLAIDRSNEPWTRRAENADGFL